MQINGVEYKMTFGAIAPIRYYMEFGESLIKNQCTKVSELNEEQAQKLLWCMIEGERPSLKEFSKQCAEDMHFWRKVYTAIRNILRCRPVPRKNVPEKSEDNEPIFDELELLCVFMKHGIGEYLLKNFSIYQAMEIASKLSQMSGKDYMQKKKMSNTQIVRQYGISEEQQAAIDKLAKDGVI